MKRFVFLLSAFTIFIASWLYIVLSPNSVTQHMSPLGRLLILFAPLEAVVLFGLYSVATILKRLIFFPECPAAADSLQEEMKQARKDLESKGFKFDKPSKAK